MSAPHRDDELSPRYFDRALDADEVAALQRLLLTDARAAEHFALRCRLEADLEASF